MPPDESAGHVTVVICKAGARVREMSGVETSVPCGSQKSKFCPTKLRHSLAITIEFIHIVPRVIEKKPNMYSCWYIYSKSAVNI